ncbi:hypothetical protein WA026_009542 [Henosepilachna vigintioctopunctata]|uniref:Uncharacterized protein n=1 Tax=Henosepilachna vigintioctopunctata TaxID=420089 RepID=A0AAW1U469_9CUCU
MNTYINLGLILFGIHSVQDSLKITNMNTLIVAALACLATAAYAVPYGHGVVVSGPSGVVTNHGAIGPIGHGWGHGHGVALAAPAVIAHNALVPQVWGHGYGHGINSWGLGYGHGVAAVTPGHGSISASAHGAAIRGPPTAPVVVEGPAGKVVAHGLWGPTANIGGHGVHGAVGHIGYGHGYRWW